MHIKQSTIKSTKKSLIDDLSRELLDAAIGLKSKCKEEGSDCVSCKKYTGNSHVGSKTIVK